MQMTKGEAPSKVIGNPIKRRKIELVKNTVNFYKDNPRGTDEETGKCVYINEEGDKCAAGRLFSDKALDWIKENDLQTQRLGAIIRMAQMEGIPLYKPEYRWLIGEKNFLFQLQAIHDDFASWDGGELTSQGVQLTSRVIENVEEGNL